MLQYTGDKLISSQAISTQVEMRVGFITEGVFYCAFSRLAPYVVNTFYPLIYVAYGLYRSFYTSPGSCWQRNDGLI